MTQQNRLLIFQERLVDTMGLPPSMIRRYQTHLKRSLAGNFDQIAAAGIELEASPSPPPPSPSHPPPSHLPAAVTVPLSEPRLGSPLMTDTTTQWAGGGYRGEELWTGGSEARQMVSTQRIITMYKKWFRKKNLLCNFQKLCLQRYDAV